MEKSSAFRWLAPEAMPERGGRRRPVAQSRLSLHPCEEWITPPRSTKRQLAGSASRVEKYSCCITFLNISSRLDLVWKPQHRAEGERKHGPFIETICPAPFRPRFLAGQTPSLLGTRETRLRSLADSGALNRVARTRRRSPSTCSGVAPSLLNRNSVMARASSPSPENT